MLPATRIHTKG